MVLEGPNSPSDGGNIADPSPFRGGMYGMKMYEGVQGARYYLVQTLPQFREFLELAQRQRALAVDTEASGLDWVKSDVCGISIGWGLEHNYYLPIDHKTNEKQLDLEAIRFELAALLGAEHRSCIFANAKFDLHGLRKKGLEIGGIIHDIVTNAHLVDENTDHGVKEMAVAYLDKNADKWDKRINAWRIDESKRRRHEFQQLVKDRAAALVADTAFLLSNKLLAIDPATRRPPKETKDFARTVAAREFSNRLCARNKKSEVSYDYIPLDEMTPYACADVHYTWMLHKIFIPQIAGHSDLAGLYQNEMRLIRELFESEHAGAKINVPYLVQLEPQLVEEIKKREEEIYADIGFQFNIDSDAQLIGALEHAGVRLTKLTKGSQEKQKQGETEGLKYAVDKEVLEYIATKHPFAAKVLDYRKLTKLLGTYVIGIREGVDENSFLHCDYNPNVSTGRMSSRDPNLQNIPARNKSIRKAFVIPDDEYAFLFFDYSQIELRLTADRSEDPVLLSCYPFEGAAKDVHTITLADVVLAQPLDQVNAMKKDKTGHVDNPARGESCECPACQYEFFRNIAKRVNFGIIYGAGPGAIQRQVSTPSRQVSKEECQSYIERYLEKYRGVKEWITATEWFMKKHGWVQNTFGRFRRLPDIRSVQKWQRGRAARQGVNFLIQGEAADLFKVAAVRVGEIFRKHKARSRLVNFVHDELQFYWHKEEFELLKPVKQAMEDFEYKVPIVAEMAYSPTDWGSKKELKAA